MVCSLEKTFFKVVGVLFFLVLMIFCNTVGTRTEEEPSIIVTPTEKSKEGVLL